jgi:general secretion pathway protein A
LLGAYGKNASRANKGLLAVAAAEVMGETRPESRGRHHFSVAATIAVIAAGAVLALVAAGWFYLGQEGEPLAAAEPVLLAEPTTPVSPPVEAQLPEPVADISPAAETGVESTSITGAEPEPLLSIDTAEELLWSLYSPSPMPTELCPRQEQAGLLCSVGSARTWDELQQFDRPILLSMITPDRFSAGVVLLSIAGREATVATMDGVIEVELAQIGSMWTGDYTYLWHPPAGFNRPIALGDSGPVVGEVARLFARLDQQTTALAQERFNRALDQRVRLFQRNNGLADDGVVGERTLLKLNEQLAVDVTASQARQRLQAQSMDVVQQ